MPNDKIKNLDELSIILKKLKDAGRKIIHCHGAFDLVHPGHIRHFQAAKALGDVLVVTVTADEYVNKGPGRPVFIQGLRAESIAALGCVDYVAINFSFNAAELIKKLSPDIYVKDKEYADAAKDETCGIFLERGAVESVGGKISFTDEITFSSSSLLNEYFDIYSEPVQNFLKKFRERYTAEQVIEKVKNLNNLRALVIGETILDEYAFMAPMLGKPPKGNHIAMRFLSEEVHAGGIIACANHLANFCGKVDLVTAVGNDGKEEFVRSHLKPNINPKLFVHTEAPTITKRRFVDNAFFNKLFEIYIIDDKISLRLEDMVKAYIGKIFLSEVYDLILVLDYGHGLLTPSLIRLICDQNHFLAVNAQTNTANMGFNPITKYPRANYFCLDDRELRMAFQDNYNDVKILVKSLATKMSFLRGGIAVTLGHLGSITYDVKTQEFYNAPILSQKIVDTTGAGDAFLALTAPCVASGFPMDLVAFIGNVAGALAVGYLGNRSSIEAAPFFKFITALLK